MNSILTSILFSRRKKSPLGALLSFAMMAGLCGLILFGGVMQPSEKFTDKPEMLNQMEQYQINVQVPYLNEMSRMLMSTEIADPDYMKTSLFIPNKYKKDIDVNDVNQPNVYETKPQSSKTTNDKNSRIQSKWKQFEQELLDRDFNEPGNLFMFGLSIAIMVTFLHMCIFCCCWIKTCCCVTSG